MRQLALLGAFFCSIFLQAMEGSILVINTETQALAKVIQSAVLTDPHAIAIDYANNKMYVVNFDSRAGKSPGIVIIDMLTDSIVSTITDAALTNPNAITIDSAHHKIYVANFEREGGIGHGAGFGTSIVSFDTQTGKRDRIVTSWECLSPIAIAHDVDYRETYVVNLHVCADELPGVLVLDASGEIRHRVVHPAFLMPNTIALHSTHHKAYVSNLYRQKDMYKTSVGEGTILVMDMGSHRVMTLIQSPLLVNPRAMAVDPSMGKLYVANFPMAYGDSCDSPIVVIDTRTDTVSQVITHPALENPRAIAVDCLHHRAYVVNSDSKRGNMPGVVVIDTLTDTVLHTLTDAVFHHPCALAVDANASKLYVLNAKEEE